jgi:hypothetical protein
MQQSPPDQSNCPLVYSNWFDYVSALGFMVSPCDFRGIEYVGISPDV